MSQLVDFLYLITSGLLVPCIAYLLYLLFKSLLAIGRYLSQQQAKKNQYEALVQWAHDSAPLRFSNIPSAHQRGQFAEKIRQLLSCGSLSQAEYLISAYEISLDRDVSQFSQQAKLGPIVGLMGTLIPMGPALQGLANGNIQQLASQMQVAFTTTVIGLVIGALGFSMHQIKRREVFRELALLDLVSQTSEDLYDGKKISKVA